MVPLFSAPERRPPFRRRPLRPATPSRTFAQRLAAGLLWSRPRVLAIATRTSLALDPTWEVIVSNLERLARHRGTRFLTASAAIEPLEPTAVSSR